MMYVKNRRVIDMLQLQRSAQEYFAQIHHTLTLNFDRSWDSQKRSTNLDQCRQRTIESSMQADSADHVIRRDSAL
jgi:hypothetical protein